MNPDVKNPNDGPMPRRLGPNRLGRKGPPAFGIRCVASSSAGVRSRALIRLREMNRFLVAR